MNQKKLQILNAAKELFYRNGFADTSVTDIIKLANVSKGTFYNHFSSKSECMIAIFQDIHERSVAERKLITHLNNRYDIATLEKELIAHFSIVIESNIMDLMTNNMNSKDNGEIFEYIKSKSLREVNWLGNRLNEIYGPHIKNNAYDFAAMIFGSIQQITLIRTVTTPSNLQVKDIVVRVLSNIKPSIYSTRENNAPLINKQVLIENKHLDSQHNQLSIEALIEDLEVFYNYYKGAFTLENTEYTKTLIVYLKTRKEFIPVIRSLAFSFINSFKGSFLYHEALVLFQEIEGSISLEKF